jgi:uncharacterized protein (TIGR02597 family)
MLYPPPLTKGVIALGALLSLVAVPLSAQTATSTTPPVGYVRTELLGESDTFAAASLTRSPVYTGTVESATGTTITVTGSPNWQASELTYVPGSQPNTYYVRIGAAPNNENNPFEGRDFKVELNGENTLLVTDPLSADLADMPVGTKIEVIPYWTLNTLFPPEDAGVSFEASPSILSRKTEVYFTDTQKKGVNLPYFETYYFSNGMWKLFGGDISRDYGDTVINPRVPIKIRNINIQNLALTLCGNVPASVQTTHLQTHVDSKQDSILSTGMPVPVKLRDLGLVESNAFEPSLSILARIDELYVYSNSDTGTNKPPNATYYYMNGTWKKFGGNISLDYGDDLIGPDERFIIRKEQTTHGDPVLWTISREN